MHLAHHRHRRAHEVAHDVLGPLRRLILVGHHHRRLVHEPTTDVAPDHPHRTRGLEELPGLPQRVLPPVGRLVVEERGTDATGRRMRVHLGFDELVLGDVLDTREVERGELLRELGHCGHPGKAARVRRRELLVDEVRERVGHLLRELLQALRGFIELWCLFVGHHSLRVDRHPGVPERERCLDSRWTASVPVAGADGRRDDAASVVAAEHAAPRHRHDDRAGRDLAGELHRVDGGIDALENPLVHLADALETRLIARADVRFVVDGDAAVR